MGLELVKGPNGSGKTRELQSLLRGALSDGRRVGYVGQGQPRQFSAVFVEDCLAIPLVLSGLRLQQSRELALEQLSRLGLSYLASRTIRALSGGEAQVVSLLAELGPFSAESDIGATVLVDDPCSMLDMENAAFVRSSIDKLASMQNVRVVETRLLSPLDNSATLDQLRSWADDLMKLPLVARRSAPNWVIGPTPVRFGGEVVGEVSERIELVSGTMGILTGANGAGKSVFLRAMRRKPGAVYLSQMLQAAFPGGVLGGHVASMPTSAQRAIEKLFCILTGKPPDWGSMGYGHRRLASLLIVVFRILMSHRFTNILLDEPDSALDDSHAAAVAQVCQALRRAGCIVLVATHRPPVYGSGHLPVGIRKMPRQGSSRG